MALDINGELVEIALATGLPVWCGYSCKLSRDGKTLYLYDGTAPQDGGDDGARFASALSESLHEGLAGAGPMHCDMETTGLAIASLKSHWRGPVFAYPNSGHALHRPWQKGDMTTPSEFVEASLGWVEAGTQVVGGCCGIHPEHIAALSCSLGVKPSRE